MKKPIAILVATISTIICTYAQLDRSKPPIPSPQKAIKIAEYQSFNLQNGLQVFVIENHKLPRVQFFIQLLHDPIKEGDKAGYTSIAGDLMGRGTKTRSKIQLDEEINYIGGALDVSTDAISASSLTKYQDKLLKLITDVLYNPSFEEEELGKLKEQAFSVIAANREDPDVVSQNVQNLLLYGKDHPYGELITEETINNITVEDCKKYYETYFRPNNAYLVIIGDITLEEAQGIAKENFSTWTPKKHIKTNYQKPAPPDKTVVAVIDRPAAVQSIITIAHPVDIKVGSPSALKVNVMNQILGGGSSARLFLNLREQRGYTYGAYSQFEIDDIVGEFNAYTSTRNEVTDHAIYEILEELKQIREKRVTAEELQEAKAIMAGQFIHSLEQPSTIADFAMNTAKYNLPKDYYSTFLARLAAISAEDVQQAAKKYIYPDRAYIQVLGRGEEVVAGLKKFGPIMYYDVYGNKYDKAELKLPTGITAQHVIKNYIDAIGGKEKIEAIKTIEMHYKCSVGPTEFDMTVLKKEPKKVVIEMKKGEDMILQRLVSDGKNIYISQAGKQVTGDKQTRENLLYNSIIFPELKIGKDFKVELLKMKNVDNKQAYVVEYTHLSGQKHLVYYDKATALKIREIEVVEGSPKLVTNWMEYKEKDGVKFPWVVQQGQRGMDLSLRLIDLKINPEIADTVFGVE